MFTLFLGIGRTFSYTWQLAYHVVSEDFRESEQQPHSQPQERPGYNGRFRYNISNCKFFIIRFIKRTQTYIKDSKKFAQLF